jgi:hypothetical protein
MKYEYMETFWLAGGSRSLAAICPYWTSALSVPLLTQPLATAHIAILKLEAKYQNFQEKPSEDTSWLRSSTKLGHFLIGLICWMTEHDRSQ